MKKSSLIAASFVAMAAVVIVIAQTRRPQPAAGSATGSDRKVYAEGPAPALPRAGGTFLDPAFGSTIMRLTDEVDGTACINFYSYWPSFNLDSTRLIIRCDADAKLYRFDPNRFQIVGKGPLFERPAPGGGNLSVEDAIWSGTSATVLYGYSESKLFAYDVATKTYTLIKDFGFELPGNYLGQMSKSLDDNVFAFTRKDRNYKPVGYVVWRRDQNRIVRNETVLSFDEAQVDKSGRYVVVKAKFDRSVDVQVIDLQTGTTESLTDPGPDFSPGHSDNGRQIVVGHDNWNNQYTVRKLAAPHQFQTVIGFGNDWSQANHVSMLGDDDGWCVISNYTAGNGPVGPFRNEIFMASTDGSQRVKRLAQHRSVYRDYWDTPRANISRDGRFIVFTSNWGSTTRRDVFIIKIPPINP